MSTEDSQPTVRSRRLRRPEDGPAAIAVLVALGVLAVAALVVVIVAGIDPDEPAPEQAGSGIRLPAPVTFAPEAVPVPVGSPSPSASLSRTSRAATRAPERRTSPPTSRPPTGLTPGALISLEPAGSGAGLRLRHRDFQARIDRIGPRSPETDRADATFRVRAGLGDGKCVSFEAVNYPGRYLRHQNFVLGLQPDDGSGLFDADATFCPQSRGGPVVFRAVNFPRFLLVRDSRVVLAEVTADAATAFTAGPPA